MFCWRCGKTLKKNQSQWMVLPDGITVPVCRDDRNCPETVCGSKHKREMLLRKELIA
ncbi:hypothetical protein [Pectinatus frisingensis]|uniref:hypothetical protein n=1 Tax=Pectinatus frisingensis TaxID=865 RepID=UPI0018C54C18|nr:hypothetical protein [Pectinatus frisingensis]